MSPSPERRLETVQQGKAFCQTTSAIWPAELPDLAYPVAVGAAAKLAGLPLQETLLFYLHGFAGNLTSAAIRLVPLGQTEGQAALAALAPLCERLASEAQASTTDDLGGASFLADIASMKHETQYSRLFRS
jgi:urease accessory protein